MSDQSFVSYERIDDHTRGWQVDPAVMRRLQKLRWVVTEKIHGANFCFVIDGLGVRCAKRKALLAQGESFFGHERVLRRLEPSLTALWELARRAEATGAGGQGAPLCGDRLERLMVYGELFGGGYPHEAVAPVAGVQPVQTGVWYSPEVEFCAFDVAVLERGGGSQRYLSFEVAQGLLRSAGVFCVEPLLVGSWQQAQAHPVGFDSTLPARLGLPPLPRGSNPAEGVVMRPVESVTVETKRGLARPALKKKIASFAEDRRYHQAQAWEGVGPQREGALDEATATAMWSWELKARVNEMRVHSAISKQGRPSLGDVGALEGLKQMIFEDVFDEVDEAHPELRPTLGVEARASVEAELEEEVAVWVALVLDL